MYITTEHIDKFYYHNLLILHLDIKNQLFKKCNNFINIFIYIYKYISRKIGR